MSHTRAAPSRNLATVSCDVRLTVCCCFSGERIHFAAWSLRGPRGDVSASCVINTSNAKPSHEGAKTSFHGNGVHSQCAEYYTGPKERGTRGASTLSSQRTGATRLRPGCRRMNIACNGQTVCVGACVWHCFPITGDPFYHYVMVLLEICCFKVLLLSCIIHFC